MSKKAYGTYEIAKICQVTPSTVGNWVDKGILPTFSTAGGHRRVWTNDLLEFLKKHNIPVSKDLADTGALEILIVDDEEQIRRMVRRALQKAYPKALVYEAVDGFEAGQKIAQIIPALVILDLKLPGIDGFKVCRIIRSNEKLKNIRILAISGYNVEESKRQVLSAGADDFLGKLFDLKDLNERIAKLCGAAQK